MSGAGSHLELVVVRLAAAVRLLRCVFVGVKQETDAAVKTCFHMFDTCRKTIVLMMTPFFFFFFF